MVTSELQNKTLKVIICKLAFLDYFTISEFIE